MTPDELAELVDHERGFRGHRPVHDLNELTLADRLDDDEDRLLGGLL